jgi:hypothetical protein
VRYPGIKVDDVLAIAEQVGVRIQRGKADHPLVLRFPPNLRKPTSGLYEYIP